MAAARDALSVGALSSAGALGALSARLTEAILQVELQRSTLDEVVLRLADQARHLNGVAGVLTEQSREQAHVLQELLHLVSVGSAEPHVGKGVGEGADRQQAQQAHVEQPSELASKRLSSSGAQQHSHVAGPSPLPVVPRATCSNQTSSREPAVSNSQSLPTQNEPETSPSTRSVATISKPATPRLPVIEPDMSDEDGIEYISDLRIEGVRETLMSC